MRLTLQEIRQRAIQFAHEWKEEKSERAEAQTFWNEFFEVFGIRRRSVASFERTVVNLKGAYDRIDVIWEGVLIGEHKSRGQNLDKAATQAFSYVQSLTRAHRDKEIPRYIIVSDFEKIAVHDLESTDTPALGITISLRDLHEHVRLFDFISGYQSRPLDPEDPINIEAVAVLGTLHDELRAGGYNGRDLERFLVRVLFCLFADDTGIFDPDTFKLLVEESNEDGSTLGPLLARFFEILNTPEREHAKSLPEALRTLPYINGNLFVDHLDFANFNSDMRNALLAACRFQWARISPAVFGSLFQSILADDAVKKKRRQIGAHYTSERDIMKVVRSLFLDNLEAEFESIRSSRPKLLSFHDKLARLKFLDPACGCGNFLVVTYRELRRLELKVIDALFGELKLLDLNNAVRVNVDQMYGIEIEVWPARIAQVAMWLVDHQMNLEASQKFGKALIRLPLKKSTHIHIENVLRSDWNDVLPASECNFVLGNPPFVGAKFQNEEQRSDVQHVAGHVENSGLLDYVTLWYFKAAQFISSTCIGSFVSTNSICQGEQAGVLWEALFNAGLNIHFAHRTFVWESEARGKAHVHVVIVGFGRFEPQKRTIYDYSTNAAEPQIINVTRINGYLTNGVVVAIKNRGKPLCDVPEIGIGNKPIDDGNYLFTDDEKAEFIKSTPASRPLFRRWLGSDEFINGYHRWCLWIGDCSMSEIRAMPEVAKRVDAVREFRLASKSKPTQRLAEQPTRFHVENMPTTQFLLIPKVSSERRNYIPIGFMKPATLVSDLVFILPNATLYHFGVLTSAMHMAWVRQVCGRLESRYRYSNKLVYNNYPWPIEATEKQKHAVEIAGQEVLNARAAFPGETLADLYDPLVMPKALLDAHRKVNRAVDRCYRPAPFDSDRLRVEFLFGLYERLTSLFAKPKLRRVRANP